MIDQHEYGYFTEANSSGVVIARNRNSTDERLKQIMAVIIRKLHEAVKESGRQRRSGSPRSSS
jgi:catechol 1,2-dioxygenase